MDISTTQFANLYAWYSWPNVILPIIGGYLMDSVFGTRLGAVIFAGFIIMGESEIRQEYSDQVQNKIRVVQICLLIKCFTNIEGQIIFAAGGLLGSFIIMQVGRFVFGIGGESLAVAQNTYAVTWFKGKELNMVFGFQVSGIFFIANIFNWPIMFMIFSNS